MDDLISRSALLEKSYYIGISEVVFKVDVKKAPAVDAVEVVRCEDCDCWDEEYKAGRASLGNLVCLCHEWSDFEDSRYVYTRPDEYCSRGERKENADN